VPSEAADQLRPTYGGRAVARHRTATPIRGPGRRAHRCRPTSERS
jgi:hypothetical protein